VGATRFVGENWPEREIDDNEILLCAVSGKQVPCFWKVSLCLCLVGKQ
jgi:hypothetical protein